MASQQVPPPHSDNVDEELHRIRLALQTVFSCPAPSQPQQQQQHQQQQWWSERQLADRYLTSFQTSTPVAWMVCDRLLQEDNNNAEAATIHFFAAQTLHTKCCADVHELPASSLPSLRDSLLQHLQRYTGGRDHMSSSATGAALTTRLAMCVSALAVHMGWTTVIADVLANIKSESNQPNSIRMALSILQTLPEECASDRLLLLPETEQNRFLMRDHLIGSAPNVFAFLFYIYQSCRDQEGAKESTLAVFRTFYLWIRYVPIQPTALLESPLLTVAVLPAMANLTSIDDDILELAADVIVEVLRMYPSDCSGNEPLVQQLIPALAQLPLQQALMQSNSNEQLQHQQQEADNIWRAYCRVVTEMGESYMSVILGYHDSRDDGPQRLVNWVLQCSQIPDHEIASMTLHFWFRFVADLDAMEPMEWRQDLVDMYSSQLLQLMRVCVTHLLRFHDDTMSEDATDDWLRHRSFVQETIQDGCRLLGGQAVFHALGNLLKEQVQGIQNNNISDWSGLEACLAGVCAVRMFVPNDEADVLPLCFQLLIPQLPSGQNRLRHTASQTIGSFAPWLAAHPDLVPPLLNFLAQGLQEDYAPDAAIAIKELCKGSNAQTFNLVEPVWKLYEETMGRLDLSNELHLLEGVCRALARSHFQSNDGGVGAQALTRLVQPMLHRLTATVNDAAAPLRRITAELDRLTVVVRFLTLPWSPSQGQHPMLDLLQSSWPLLEAATNRFPHDNMLAENICRLHKHTLRVCGARAFAPMLNDLLQQLVYSFERTHQSPYLYAASICITEYGADPTYAPQLYDTVAMMARIVFSFLRTLEEFINHPDVVEEFFYLLARTMTYCPHVVMPQTSLLHSLVQCAVVGVELQHPGANKGTLQFLDKCLSHGLKLRENDNNQQVLAPLEQVLAQEGASLVAQLVRAVVGDLPSSPPVLEILWKLNLLCPGLLAQWLTKGLATSTLTDRAKTEFFSALNTTHERDDFRLVLNALQSACDRERRRLRTAVRRA